MTQTYAPPAPTTSAGVRLGLLGVWAALTAGALAYVLLLGTNAPYADEWEFVPVLVGDEPALPWLWAQHNEHRMVLPRAVVLAYFRATRDFRAGMVLQVAILSAAALALMRVAARVRGAPHWADAFFPVSLLHLGHWENLLMGYQVCFVLYLALVSALIVVALGVRPGNAFRSGAAAGVLALLLALTGGSGLVVAAPVCLWVGFVAATRWRAAARVQAVVLLVLALLPVVYAGLYFRGYERPGHHPPACVDPIRVPALAGQVVGVSFGMGLMAVWPLVAGGVTGVGGLTLARLRPWWGDPERRLSAAGLVAVAAGVAAVAVAVGVGRGGFDEWYRMGLWWRYTVLSWPLLAAAYLTWLKIGPTPERLNGAKWVPVVLCVTAALAFPGNTATGMMNGADVAADYAAIAAQVRAGRPAARIVTAEPFTRSAHQLQGDRAERAIPLLRRERVGIFAR